ncbi:MAG: monooxygenase [Mycobacteriales bacterium]
MRQALPRVAVDRVRIRRLPFARLLGTARGFDLASTDLHRWLLMVDTDGSFETSSVVRGWDALASERATLTLRPLASRGTWGGRDPFGSGTRWDGPVLSLTHARLSPRRMAGFSRALPPVAEAALAADGLRWWMGFGEAPVGFKGTLTAWSSSAAASDFAFRSDVHVDVIRRTPVERWYAEELFTRFALLDADGTLDGLPAARLAAPA